MQFNTYNHANKHGLTCGQQIGVEATRLGSLEVVEPKHQDPVLAPQRMRCAWRCLGGGGGGGGGKIQNESRKIKNIFVHLLYAH